MSRAWLYVLTQLPDCTAAGPLQRALLHLVLFSHVNPLMDSAIAMWGLGSRRWIFTLR